MLLCKVSTILLILGIAFRRPFQPLGSGLAVGSCQRHHSIVYLNAHITTCGLDNGRKDIHHLPSGTVSHARGSSPQLPCRDSPGQQQSATAGGRKQLFLVPRDCSCLALLPVLTYSQDWMSDTRHLLLVLPGQLWIWVGQGATGSRFLAQKGVGWLSIVVGRPEA